MFAIVVLYSHCVCTYVHMEACVVYTQCHLEHNKVHVWSSYFGMYSESVILTNTSVIGNTIFGDFFTLHENPQIVFLCLHSWSR